MTVRACVGCGFCCLKAQCAFSLRFKPDLEIPKREGPICPFLYILHGRFRCELAEQYPKELNIGEGCCASLNSARSDFVNFRNNP